MTSAAVLTHLVEVEFKGNRRAFFTWSGDAPPKLRAAVIVQVERGEDLGRIHATGELADKRRTGTSHGKASPAELPRVVRLATAHEVDNSVRLRVDEEAVRKAALELVREMHLDMKVSDTEWQWDRRRLTCYFTAEDRVDFRQLVRQLEKRFSTRVHMWHIGVRDEARRLDGIGRCGRQFCSASWLPELRPVKSSAAKDQRLSTLNPAQISGTCGRLMCCLRYEHEFYVQSRKRFPKEGKIVTTTIGEEKIVSNDIFRDLVTLRTATGEARTIPLLQLRRELGETNLPMVEESSDDDADAGHDAHEVHQEREARGTRATRAARDLSARGPLVVLARAVAPVEPDPAASRHVHSESLTPEIELDGAPLRGEKGDADDGDDTDHGDDENDAGESVEPAAGAEATAAGAAATAAGAESAATKSDANARTSERADADAKKRGRRRRGRRGGRRGRGGDGKPGSPPPT